METKNKDQGRWKQIKKRSLLIGGLGIGLAMSSLALARPHGGGWGGHGKHRGGFHGMRLLKMFHSLDLTLGVAFVTPFDQEHPDTVLFFPPVAGG